MTEAPAPAEKSEQTNCPIVVDLGKKRRKSIKNLRRGSGKLMAQVQQCLAELTESGTISASAQTVVVVVQEKRKSPRGLRLPLLSMLR